MKLKMKHLNLMVIAFGISLMASCYPYDSVYTDDLDLTLTLYDTTADFGSYNKNIYVRETVGLISNHVKDTLLEKAKADLIIEGVKKKYIDEGYTVVDNIEAADFYINNVIFNIESTSYYYYPGWWYGYPGYWPYYPYWKKSTSYYGYYPGYPGYYPPYSYTTYYGTLYSEMIDADSFIEADEDTPINILWQIFINGVLSTDDSYNAQRLVRGYNEAFEQSPYLKN